MKTITNHDFINLYEAIRKMENTPACPKTPIMINGHEVYIVLTDHSKSSIFAEHTERIK